MTTTLKRSRLLSAAPRGGRNRRHHVILLGAVQGGERLTVGIMVSTDVDGGWGAKAVPVLVPAFNYLQTAACLYEDGALSAAGVVQVARSLLEDSNYDPERLANSLGDIERRAAAAAPSDLAIDYRTLVGLEVPGEGASA